MNSHYRKTSTRFVASVLLVLCGGGAVHAQVQSFDPGPFGEVTTWLVAYLPPATLEKDPLEAIGGEAKFAAMSDAKLAPFGGKWIGLLGQTAHEKDRLGDRRLPFGTWEVSKMLPQECPGLWHEYPYLHVDALHSHVNGYAYCQLLSPQDMPGSLLVGTNSGRCRFYFNGKDLGIITRPPGAAVEDTHELPIDLRKGVNHLLVRIENRANLSCRLIGPSAEPLKSVKVQIGAPYPLVFKPAAPVLLAAREILTNRSQELGPLSPPEHPEFLGVKLARTMALLESGKYTHRPVRIMFSGQSIEGEWANLLIQRLRERYPDTTIIWENRAIGGWFVWRLQKLLKHDILRWQPDLVLFSAYQGSAEVWERFLSELRSETTADIVIRTAHLSGKGVTADDSPETAETILLRRLAQKYDVELVELRSEWMKYFKTNNLPISALMSDGIHLNAKGHALMAMLYERHFRYNAVSRGWADTVRRFDVGRFLEDHKTDEIVLAGQCWSRTGRGYAQSCSSQDTLRLKFHGTRVDLILPPGRGGATVLIDGKKPNQWNLFHGTRPRNRTTEWCVEWNQPPLNVPMAYHLGKDMQEETWVLTLTHASADKLHIRFRLTGSKTGFDGEGENDRNFVSNSGRITILTTDWCEAAVNRSNPTAAPGVLEPLKKPLQVVWHIVPDGRDTVYCEPNLPPNNDWYSGMPYSYVTIADGLPCGLHELTLTPLGDPSPLSSFVISGVEVHRPPLARDASECTTP